MGFGGVKGDMYMSALKVIKSIEELQYLFKILKDKNVSIFGASKFGIEIYNIFRDENIQISNIYDNDKKKVNTYFNNEIKIKKPSKAGIEEHIIIASMYYKEIYKQLKNMHIEHIYYIPHEIIDYYNYKRNLDVNLLSYIYSNKMKSYKSDKINILHLYDLMELGGIETHIITLSNQLNKLNTNNIIVAPNGPAAELAIQYNLDYRAVDINRKEMINEIVMEINSIIIENNINIIHTHSPTAQILGNFCGTLSRVPVVSTKHSVLHANYIENIYNTVTKYVCVSDEVAKECIKNGISREKITIINNCVETVEEPQKSSFFKDDYIRITYISRIVYDKFQAIVNLLSAVEKLDNFKLNIIGDGNMFHELKEIVRKNGRRENISILGSKSNISKYIMNSDVIVGVGRVILEAIANGKFAICLGNVNYPGLINREKLKKISEVNFTDRNIKRKFKDNFFIQDIERIYNNFENEFDRLVDTYQFLHDYYSIEISAIKHYNLYKSIINKKYLYSRI